MPELVLSRDGKELRRIPLADQAVTIGRLDDNDIVLNDDRASRHHARIVPRFRHYLFEDLKSFNGSFLGQKKLKRRRLRDGDELSVAGHTIIYRSESAPLQPAESEEETAPEHAASQPMAVTNENPTEPNRTRLFDAGSVALEQNVNLMQSVFLDPQASLEGSKRLQALFEISQSLETARDFDTLLVEIMDKAIAIMGGDRGFLMLLDRDTGELRVHVARDRNGDISGAEQESISSTLVRRVVDEGRPVLVNEAQNEELGTESVYAHSIHSAICTPLLTRETVTGVIYVDHRSRANAFGKQDLAFFSTFALQAKAAIDNSRAYWELVDSLFRASDDFIVVCSPAGLVRQANRAAADLFGVPTEELAGRPLPSLVVESSKAGAEALQRDTLETGVVSGRELELEGAEGRLVPLSVSSFVMRGLQDETLGFCVIGRDLTELKALIAKLTQANEFIRATFGRYLSDQVVDSLLESPKGLELGGELRQVTVLISDLRGFTATSERLEPQQVVSLLNNHLGTMTEIIEKHGGTIDEFLGDGILVIFGAPQGRDDDALRAAACAVEMQLAMDEVNARGAAEGLPRVEMGIGLNTGDVVVGNIGSTKRSKYAVVGAAVNTGYRIESKTVGGQILISQSTVAAAGPGLQLGQKLEFRLKGIEGLLEAHELVGIRVGDVEQHLTRLDDQRRRLPAPLPVRFARLDGKDVGGEKRHGEITALGELTAEIRADSTLAPLTSILVTIDAEGAPAEDVYAKVVDEPTAAGDGSFIVRFTSMPPETGRFLSSC